ncbi:MAG: hypothetical protein ACRC62_04240 [Microcoleus sp.]
MRLERAFDRSLLNPVCTSPDRPCTIGEYQSHRRCAAVFRSRFGIINAIVLS